MQQYFEPGSDYHYAIDQRLKSCFKGLRNEKLMITRTYRKILTNQKRAKEKQENKVLDDFTVIQAFSDHQKALLRHQSRAVHLARMFLKNKNYKKVEEKINKTTMPADIVIERYFPEALLQMSHFQKIVGLDKEDLLVWMKRECL